MRYDGHMTTSIPAVEEVSRRLKGLKGCELEQLAGDSGVPASTLWKIRVGATPNPGLETVRKFFHLLPAELAQQTPHPAQEATTQGAVNA